MKILFLGTGTSVGIPMIGCTCPVCKSSDPRNKRRRASLYFEAAGKHIVVDTSPDFRAQALDFLIPRVDAVLFTHSHADHIFGLDDIRRFNTIQGCSIPAYASPDTMADLKRVFGYANVEETPGVYRPQIDFREITGPFKIGDIEVETLPVPHGAKPAMGFVFIAEGHKVAYFPDCQEMSRQTIEKLKGADIMILDALRHRPHKTHMTLEESLKALSLISAKQSFIIHMCHDLDHEKTQNNLPASVYVSYDGFEIHL